MKTRNFQIENKLSNSKSKKNSNATPAPFRQLSFGVSNPLAYIVVITLVTILHFALRKMNAGT